jgi:hypothetical protein
MEETDPSADLIDMVRSWDTLWTADKHGAPQVLIGSWLEREAHLAVRRAHEAMADGIPPDTAFFCAVDDMGFQLALAYVKACSG